MNAWSKVQKSLRVEKVNFNRASYVVLNSQIYQHIIVVILKKWKIQLTWNLAEERMYFQGAGAVDGAPPEVGGGVDGDALRRRSGTARRLVPVAFRRL